MARTANIAGRRNARPVEQLFRPRNMPARRRRRAFVRNLFKALSLALFLGALIFGLNRFIEDSPTFLVREVTIDGANVLREEAILAKAGITVNMKLLDTEPEAIADRLLEWPYVAHCTVERAYPDRLIITLQERVPAATIMMNQRTYEVDREGRVLREIDSLMPHVGPLITNLPVLQALEPGAMLEHRAFDEAMRLWEAWQTSPLSQELTLSEISAVSPTYLQMFFEELDYELRWGRSDYEVQARRLDVLWDRQQGQLPCTEYIDLRFDQELACK